MAIWMKNIRHEDVLVCSNCGFGLFPGTFVLMDCNRASDEREFCIEIRDMIQFCPNCGEEVRLADE